MRRIGWLVLSLAMLAGAETAHAWDERRGGDLPWLGAGGRARLYARDAACFGCTTGSRHEERWGRSAHSGEAPYTTAAKVMAFLGSVGALKTAPAAKGAGSAYVGGSEIVTTRALPYRFTIVMIEPTVVVMNFDLLALIKGTDRTEGDQIIGTPYIDGFVHYGTHVPATGTLLWFAPESKTPPAPVPDQASGRSAVTVNGITLVLERKGTEWAVARR